jgi:hypothetical protein
MRFRGSPDFLDSNTETATCKRPRTSPSQFTDHNTTVSHLTVTISSMDLLMLRDQRTDTEKGGPTFCGFAALTLTRQACWAHRSNKYGRHAASKLMQFLVVQNPVLITSRSSCTVVSRHFHPQYASELWRYLAYVETHAIIRQTISRPTLLDSWYS